MLGAGPLPACEGVSAGTTSLSLDEGAEPEEESLLLPRISVSTQSWERDLRRSHESVRLLWLSD